MNELLKKWFLGKRWTNWFTGTKRIFDDTQSAQAHGWKTVIVHKTKSMRASTDLPTNERIRISRLNVSHSALVYARNCPLNP